MKTNSFQEIRAMWRLVAVCMFLMLAPLTLHAQQPLQLSPNALAQIAALQQEKASWTPIQQKVDSQLLLETKRNLNQAMAPGVPQLRRTVTIGPDGRTKIDIKANVTDALLQRIEALGGTVINSFPQYNAIQADMPLSQIQTLAAESDVAFIREAIPPMLNKVNTSEGDVAHAANTARGLYNVDGIGVKVGVLSDSASTSRLIALKASGDLPDATVLPGQAGSGSDEGAAMLEIVYDLAPGAELYFATAFSGQAGFATNIQALAAAGCQVIIDDVYYFAEPVFQDGIIAQAVDTVASSGVAYFSSAGNSGNLDAGTAGVWQGDFSGIPAPPVIGGTANDFGGGVNYDTITVDSPYCYTLQWSDPSAGSANDYDLYLLDPTLNIIIVSSTNVQNGTQDPYEYINSQYDDDTGNKLVIIKHAAAAGRYLHLNANRGMLAIATDGQTWGHACANGAFCVAAVSALTAHGVGGRFSTADTVETFSSDGPRRVFYNGAGIPYTPGNFSSTGGQVRQKPDITAADGVACATPGFNPFYGTSAAAPHAGAIAALLMDQGWAMTPAEIRQTLTSTSLDIQAANWDRNSGWGIIMADTALANASTYTVTFQTDGTPGATLTGTTPQIITFGANCTSVTANNPAGYHFVNWTKGGVDYSTNNPLTVNSVTEDMTLTANYAITTRTLTVKSQSPNSGVSITVSPLDNASQGNGDTQFTRNYNHGTTVTLTAPIAAPNGNAFYRWLIDGAEFAGNQSRPVQVL
ncbi:MAG: S8 family serine peptidase, partial [Candidatus Sumerlaeota bacterium]|nr:S8 family serine peptidase [Candidatus Sumerlaeota bacterium]